MGIRAPRLLTRADHAQSQIFEEDFVCGSGALAAMGLAARSGAGEVAPTTPGTEEVEPRLEQRPRMPGATSRGDHLWSPAGLSATRRSTKAGIPAGRRNLLARRFGPLRTWAERRIDVAPVAQLDVWLDGIFDAKSLAARIGSASD